MKRCLIVGAGGFGREALAWALAMRQDEWQIAGFLDAAPHALEGKNVHFPILGDPFKWIPGPDEVFIAGIGNPEPRLRVCGALAARGAKFVTVIHPTAVVAMNAELGSGCVVAPMAIVSVNVRLGPFVLVNVASSVGHDATVDEGATISGHCDIMGYAKIGRAAFLGGQACVLPSVTVGESAIVGAGSSVVRNVSPRTTVMGVPAQLLFRHAE